MEDVLLHTPLFGDLYAIGETDRPDIFLCENDKDKKMLCCKIRETKEEEFWIIGLINDVDFVSLKSKRENVQTVLFRKDFVDLYSLKIRDEKLPVMAVDGLKYLYYLPLRPCYLK